MKNSIIIFLKGFIVGFAKLMPGISGSALAITLGCYNQIIDSIANFYKFNRKNYLFCLNFGLGFLLAIFTSSRLIVYLLNECYLLIILLFAILIASEIVSKVNSKNFIKLLFISLIFIFLSIFLFKFLKINIAVKMNFKNLFLIGILESISMMIPGISGSAILLSLGVYDKIMLSLTRIDMINILIPFILGTGVGLFLICKIFKIIIEKNQDFFENISIYFLLFSLIMLLFKLC